jgi:putative tryptophan/tyrosine transport system substrate-binding protein
MTQLSIGRLDLRSKSRYAPLEGSGGGLAMKRREFMTLIGGAAAAWPLAARAQQKPMPVIGFLGGDRSAPAVAAFSQGLRELGYIEGRNILIEYRWADGNPERFPVLVAELVALKVDVIMSAGGTLGALAAKRATTTLPIVFGAAGNPVAEGLVTNLARPGGNVTGLSTFTTELVGKWIGLLKQAMPGVSLVALLFKPDSMPELAKEIMLKEAHGSARAMGVQLQAVKARGPADFDTAFLDISSKGAGALVVLSTSAFEIERQRIVDLAAQNRLPTVYSTKNYVDIGGLMSYGPNFPDLNRRAATYVDKILKGAKPSDLPVEQPTKFELVINLKTAKTLGLTVPPTLLAQAD